MPQTTAVPPVTTTVQNSYGHTIYRCPTCGIDLWGAAVNYHELYSCRAAMEPIGAHQFNRRTGVWTFKAWKQQ